MKESLDGFSVENPFPHDEGTEFLPLKIRECQPKIIGAVRQEDVIFKTIKNFVARESRGRFLDWFYKLVLDDGENVEELAKTPLKIQQVLESILNNFEASNELVERVKRAVPLSLAGPRETEQLLSLCVILMINHFRIFLRTSLFKKTSLYSLINEIDRFKLVLNPENDQGDLYSVYVKLMEVMFDSWLGFGSLLSEAMTRALKAISKLLETEMFEYYGLFTIDYLRAIDNTMKGWLSTFAPQSDETEGMLQESHEAICQQAITLLSPSIYDLVLINYPQSTETLATLRYCFANTNNYGREGVLRSLLAMVHTRLLSVEEDTSVILDGYANCVHSLKELDPSCSFMHRVCGDIREFLKRRPDTVRKIINYITWEKREQLAEHLGSRSGTIIDEEEFRGTNDEFLPESLKMDEFDTWTPDPPDAPEGKSSHLRQSADVFNMLISVYGSKEMFVKEYRKLLSERLTSFNDKDSMFEQKYLDILKQRFNEGELSQCEVMLRDVEESQRIDAVVAGRQSVPVTSTVVSSHFWPLPELDKTQQLPQFLEEGLKFYADQYQEHKSSRKLNWLRSWGWAEVELTLGGTTVTRFVSNQHAAVLYLYAEQESWSPADVATRLGIAKGVARRRLEWWGNQGLLIQELPNGATSEVWTLTENSAHLESSTRHAGDVSDEEDGGAIEDVADAADSLETYWMYTRNYIAQNESVKAERIHKIFKMFSSPSAQGPSLEAVNTFLFRKVKQNLLTFQSGSFRVVKDTPAP